VLVSGSGGVEGRFTVGLPAQGRSIMGRWAAQIITQHITRCVFTSGLDGCTVTASCTLPSPHSMNLWVLVAMTRSLARLAWHTWHQPAHSAN
jgi:hypothetical protein